MEGWTRIEPPNPSQYQRAACLQGREEAGHDERGLGKLQPGRDVPRHAEVGVLVYRARDQAARLPPLRCKGGSAKNAALNRTAVLR